MVTARRVTRERQADVKARLLDWLTSARFSPGDKLPPERELARILAQPRHVVRSALLDLSRRGFLVRHVGRGTLVVATSEPKTPPPPPAVVLNCSSVTLAGILEARLLFEPALARMVTARASAADLERLSHHVVAIRDANTIVALECAEAELVLAMAEIANNALLTGMAKLLASSWSAYAKLRDVNASAPSDRRLATFATAVALLDAVKALDASRAAEVSRSALLDRLAQFSGFAQTETSLRMEATTTEEAS